MTAQLDVLTEKLRSVEAEIETELAKRREELRFRIENRRIVFEEAVLKRAARDQDARVALSDRRQSADDPDRAGDLFADHPDRVGRSLGHGLSGDLLSGLQDPQVRRRDYLVFDRHHLAYLNIIEKINCAYCSYANGAIAFVREVASRTEVYWCPIKHARRMLGPHPHYQGFADFGDAEGFREKLKQMKDGVKIEGRKQVVVTRESG